MFLSSIDSICVCASQLISHIASHIHKKDDVIIQGILEKMFKHANADILREEAIKRIGCQRYAPIDVSECMIGYW